MIKKKRGLPEEFISPSEAFSKGTGTMGLFWWHWDGVSEELMISPEFRELLGYSEEEYDGKIPSIDKNIHPEDVQENRALFRRLLDGDIEVYEIEYRVKVNDNWCWFYNRGTVMARDGRGKTLAAGGVAMEISRRYNRMIKRVEEGKKFEFVFRNGSMPAVIIELLGEFTGKVIDANSEMATLLNMSVEEFVGSDPFSYISKTTLEEGDVLKKQLEDTGKITTELTIEVDGEEKMLSVNAYMYQELNRQYFVGIIDDKTESFKVKKDLEASEMAVRKNEKIYRSLIQAADDRIGLFTVSGAPIIVNNAFHEVLGYSREEYLEIGFPEKIHPEDVDKLNSRKHLLFERGMTSAEYRVQHRDGHFLVMSSKSVLLSDPDMDEEYVLFIIRDITEKREFELELIEAKEKAIESDLLKSAFLANMSHEIRTPMNSIIGFSNLLADTELDENTRMGYVKRINKNSEQLLTLITDIIDLAKIESNQLSVSYSKVLLSSVVKDLMHYAEMQLSQLKKTGISMIYDPDPQHEDISIETDFVRITQILQNLLNNAIKFTSSGTIKIGYRIVSDERIRFFVRDTGIGIDNRNFELIFDQFRQIDGSNTRKFGGTGLGLAICRHLTELLGGHIWVESELQKGSQFIMELPMKSGYDIEPKRKKKKKEPEVETSEFTILMVDDDPDNLMLTSTLLLSEGYQVITADSGYRALEVLEREMLPDIVLLDLQMPVINGFLTLKLIKELYPKLKVIAQSAYALQGDREDALKAGFDEYVSKPFSRQGLIDVIQKAIKLPQKI